MPVVYGDELAENAALSRRSPQAQDFYAALVGRPVPDNFGRFRLSASHVALRLYPRRELTAALRTRVDRLLKELGGSGEAEGDGLWRTWDRDGVLFAEMVCWRSTGNVYHRTPEPPWSTHVHTYPCLPTAIARARDWGYLEESRFLSRTFKDLQRRTGAERPPSVPSVPAVPSVPDEHALQGTTIVIDARETATAAADDGCTPYVSAVLELYGQLPGTPAHPKPADRETATRLWKRGVPLEVVKAGLLTAAARRELRNREEPLPSIGSLKYFLDAIEEARNSPPDSGHVSYLVGKLEGHMKGATNGHRPRSETTKAPSRAEEV